MLQASGQESKCYEGLQTEACYLYPRCLIIETDHTDEFNVIMNLKGC